MGDFNASTGTDRVGYETCIGPHGSGIRGENGTRLLDLAKGWRLRVAGTWYQLSGIAGLGTPIPVLLRRRSITFLLAVVGGFSRIAGSFAVRSSSTLIIVCSSRLFECGLSLGGWLHLSPSLMWVVSGTEL